MDKEPSVTRPPSLKIPRDFSLGLNTRKKSSQYTPNLNVVRNKDKNKEIIKKNEQKRKSKGFKDRPNNSGNKLNKDRYVQSMGVFSQGSGEIPRNILHSERRVNIKESTSSAATSNSIVLPKIDRNSTWNINVKDENSVLNDLVKCEESDDDEGDTFFKPVSLMPERCRKIKEEESPTLDGLNLYSSLPAPFDEENPAISLVKLPDSFAGKGLSDDPNNKKLFDYTLDGMLEGQIGNLIVRKSGKIEAQIGRIKYDLSEDNTYESKEELVTIVDIGSQHSITVLGKVLNNFIMCPDFESLLK